MEGRARTSGGKNRPALERGCRRRGQDRLGGNGHDGDRCDGETERVSRPNPSTRWYRRGMASRLSAIRLPSALVLLSRLPVNSSTGMGGLP